MSLGTLTPLSQEFLLAVDSGRANFAKFWFAPNAREEGIGVYCRIRAIVFLDSAPQHLEGRFGLSAIRKIGGRKIVLFRVLVRLHATRQRDDFGEWPMPCASQQQTVVCSRICDVRWPYSQSVLLLARTHKGLEGES